MKRRQFLKTLPIAAAGVAGPGAGYALRIGLRPAA